MEEKFDKRVAVRRVIEHEEKVFDLDDAENVPQKSFAVYEENKTDIIDYNIKYIRKSDFSEYPIFYFSVKNPTEKILKWDFLPNNSGSPLVNRKGLNFINELCPSEFEYFDTIIEAPDGIITDYKIINILVSVKIADEKKTIYKDLGDFICGYRKLVAKDNPLEGHNMVRDILDESPSAGIYVSPYFKSEYKKRKLKGASFDDVEYPSRNMNSYEFYNPNTGIWERWK